MNVEPEIRDLVVKQITYLSSRSGRPIRSCGFISDFSRLSFTN
ncbi:MAG: hypothetical protein WAV89_06700 [Ignavibacteriaceae bacterium]